MSNDRPPWVAKILDDEHGRGALARRIEQFIRQQCPDGATVAQIREALDASDAEVRRALRAMESKRLAVPDRATRPVRWRVYRRTGGSLTGYYPVLDPDERQDQVDAAERLAEHARRQRPGDHDVQQAAAEVLKRCQGCQKAGDDQAREKWLAQVLKWSMRLSSALNAEDAATGRRQREKSQRGGAGRAAKFQPVRAKVQPLVDRLVLEGGHSYRRAKQLAAKQLGMSESFVRDHSANPRARR